MALLGKGAMALWFDIDGGRHDEHDHWHTHEHFAERLGIPGFLRASRWAADAGSPRYFVMYETESPDTLASAAYRERLDNPSAWTQHLMPSYRGMVRGLCSVAASAGAGIAGHLLTLRFGPASGHEEGLSKGLAALVPALAARPGIAGAHLLVSAVKPEMTREQAIRGRDADVDFVLLVCAYDGAVLQALAALELNDGVLAAMGAGAGVMAQTYRLGVSATTADVPAVAATPAAVPGATAT
jgi:hypothetical protein